MKQLLSLTFLFPVLLLCAQQPKLVVGIVVDQMRPDYLYRFYDDFGNDGFKKLMNEGFVMANTHYNYIPTYTAPGHASIYTGTTPATHGIVGNTWFHRTEGKKVYCTGDDRMKTIGDQSDERAGRQSPHRLLSTTITDELLLSSNFRSKVVSISIKDRGAVLPGGHFTKDVYWMNDNGYFITSSFYRDELPDWVAEFNQKDLTGKYLNQGWSHLKPLEDYDESLADDNPYERIFETKKAPIFPYDLNTIEKEEGREIIKSTPFGNNLVADLGIKALKALDLGKDTFPDFLALSFSSTDYVGHSFGPRSIEIQDTYLRLDQTLAQLLKELDRAVGQGNYLVFLTADHAAAENAHFLNDRGYKVDSYPYKAVGEWAAELTKEEFGENLIQEYYSHNLFLDIEKIRVKGLSVDQVIQRIQDSANELPFVKRIYSETEILRGNITDSDLTHVAKGYDPKQNGQLVVVFRPGNMEYGHTGTTHGSGYSYDTHVPNLWYGHGIKPGISYHKSYITEIAPTVAMMLKCTLPNGTSGEVLQELFRD